VKAFIEEKRLLPSEEKWSQDACLKKEVGDINAHFQKFNGNRHKRKKPTLPWRQNHLKAE